MIIIRYEIEKYKNIIEGNLLRLKPNKDGLITSFENVADRISVEKEVLENLEYLEVGFFRNRYYKDVVKNDPDPFCSNTELDGAYIEALKSLKDFIEENFSDETMIEFVFIVYARVCCITNYYENKKSIPTF